MFRTITENKYAIKILPILSGFLILFSLNNQDARADRISGVEAKSSYIAARQAEAAGQMDAARQSYKIAFTYGRNSRKNGQPLSSVTVCGESLGSLGRRVIAMQVAHMRNIQSSNSKVYNLSSCGKELELMYRNMQAIEPNNPNWYYLEALIICENEHHYVKARRLLNRCVNCPGSPSVKAKARKLLAHIKSTADQQAIWLAADVKKSRAIQTRMRNTYIPVHIRSQPTSSGSKKSSGVPDYERQARNADRRGDHAAADRLRSGGGSIRDSSIYN